MKILTLLATGGVALALTASVALAKQPPKGTALRWTEFTDVIDNDHGAPVVTFYDGVFDNVKKCNADVAAHEDNSQPPPCPLDGVSDSAICSSTGPRAFWRCFQGVYGTPLGQ